MPTITINGRRCEFTPGQMILQAANAAGVAIPQYCYHDALSIVASCRICLGEVWAPNPRNNNALEPYMGGKLMPTCQTPAADGMVVHTDSPKAVQNQKQVMEYLLINHPLDCPVCDKAGECLLQDYSYEYGRGVSRYEEVKVKQAKKDIGPTILLYADRCILCSRCVRFAREVSGTAELLIMGRGNRNEIDVFPGKALANELSANVADLCPVGALVEKDFLFAQRVWFLKETPSVDGITSSGDNIWVNHNEGRVYRLRPRENPAVNRWWITDEVRYGWKFTQREDRLRSPRRRQFGNLIESDYRRAVEAAVEGMRQAVEGGKRLGLLVSPMLSCEDAYELGRAALAIDADAVLAIGPVPTLGQDKVFPPGLKADDPKAFVMRAEKAPNARGVRRVLETLLGGTGRGGTGNDRGGTGLAGNGRGGTGLAGNGRGGTGLQTGGNTARESGATKAVLSFDQFLAYLRGGSIGAAVLTGNYPSEWATEELVNLIGARHGSGGTNPLLPQGALFTVLIDTLPGPLVESASVVLPGAAWLEKPGTFQNCRDVLQVFARAVPAPEGARAEGQIGLDLLAAAAGDRATEFDAAATRADMSRIAALSAFGPLEAPASRTESAPDMQVVEL
ncbi:MAG: (2Fe-2S)-binding protein [Phycisphaerales bacterium]|nr:(2Fe-2S)-binding protein [Phycisphaerales bacterium]